MKSTQLKKENLRNWNNFLSKTICYICNTQEELDSLLDLCEREDLCWANGKAAKNDNVIAPVKIYCHKFTSGFALTRSSIEYNSHRQVINFSDDVIHSYSTFTLSDLKTGMVVQQRDGWLGIVVKGTHKGDIITDYTGSWDSLDCYDANLLIKQDEPSDGSCDIMKVFHSGNPDIQNNILKIYVEGDCIYSRTKPETKNAIDFEDFLDFLLTSLIKELDNETV